MEKEALKNKKIRMELAQKNPQFFNLEDSNGEAEAILENILPKFGLHIGVIMAELSGHDASEIVGDLDWLSYIAKGKLSREALEAWLREDGLWFKLFGEDEE